MYNNAMDDELRKSMNEVSDRLLREALGITSNAPAQSAPPTKADMLAVLREMSAKYKPPELSGDIYLVGRVGDTATVRRAIEHAAGTYPVNIRESQYNDYPESLVIMMIGKPQWSIRGESVKQPIIIKIYLESLEQTLAKWKVAGENLAQLIERLERANGKDD